MGRNDNTARTARRIDEGIRNANGQTLGGLLNVENHPCPNRRDGGTHQLTNTMSRHKDPILTTICQTCHQTWAALDLVHNPPRRKQ